MGYFRHDAIVVTGWSYEDLVRAKKKAKKLGLFVTNIVNSHMNGLRSFLIVPDGSKEGWRTSEEGDEAREEWKKWMNKKNEYLDWAHVSYGGDDPDKAHLVDNNV